MEENKRFDFGQWSQPKNALMALGIIIFGAIVIVSILRDKIVESSQNQVSITGQGKITYQPDIAKITLGVQIDRRQTSEQAINELNERMARIISALEQVGISKEDIETQNYSLQTQYDYKDGVQTVAGYDANQKLIVKVRDIQNDKEKVGNVISFASQAGSNQMLGVSFSIDDMNELKQQARILAIEDARKKSASLAAAAGIRLGKVVGWYENDVTSPENPTPYGMEVRDLAEKGLVPAPQLPSGTEDIIIEISLTYDVK